MISDDTKQRLLDGVDLVDLIGRYVKLEKKGGGKDYYGLCPFHEEKTPSFCVVKAKQFYHCFGCGKNGNAIDFLMDYNGRGFRDAINELASIAGIQLGDTGPTDPRKVKADRDNQLCRRVLEALEHQMIVVAIAVSDAMRGEKPSDDDVETYRTASSSILRAIEAAKRRPLTEREKQFILGDEQQQEAEAA